MQWQDLKNNPSARQKLESRAKILQSIRQFFWQEGFLEMDTPLLVKEPSLEIHVDSMGTKIIDEQGRGFSGYLITSPEFCLKKLLAAGFTKIFQLGKVFRNGEPWGNGHNPEFTMLEWYETGKDYGDLMNKVEDLFVFLLQGIDGRKSQIPNPKPVVSKAEPSQINPKYQNPKLNLKSKILNLKLNYQGKEIDLTPPWPRMSMREAWQKYAGVNLDEFLTREKMAELAKQKGYQISADDSFDDLFFKIFLTEIEPKFPQGRPLFLYDYPVQMAALSRKKKDDPRYAERFELYLGGWEMANAYSELTDWQEQEVRFQEFQARRGQLGKKVYNIDEDFLAALKSGLPECAGVALGVDRLVMVLADAKDISEVIPFSARDIFTKD